MENVNTTQIIHIEKRIQNLEQVIQGKHNEISVD